MNEKGRDPQLRYRGKVGAMLRQDDALAAWLSGRTYEQVATDLGYASRSGAFKAVTAALERRTADAEERAKQGRALAIERLRPLWKKALANALGDEGGSRDILAAVQVADRLARLEGVRDPAQEIRLTLETELDREINDLLDALKRNGVDPSAVLSDPAR